MTTIRTPSVCLDFDLSPPEGAPVVTLVSGLGGQWTDWDEEFCRRLQATGRRVLRFDNRDAGRSTHFDSEPVPDLLALVRGEKVPLPYGLDDMADDVVALFDALGIERSDVVGVSMGGMIAQCVAIRHPERVRSLTSIMSTTGAPDVGQPHPEAVAVLLRAPAPDRETAVRQSLEAHRVLGSPGFPRPEAELAARAAAAYDRAHDGLATARQLAAVLAAPDRTPALRRLSVPTLVVHGLADRLIDPSGGVATAAAIPGARYLGIEGMGHELPPAVWPIVIDAFVEVAGLAEAAPN